MATQASEETPFDLVITDMTMPLLTGVGLAEKLRTLQPGLPILLCTGYSEKLDTSAVREFGIREVLIKPIEARKLAVLVRSVLNERIN